MDPVLVTGLAANPLAWLCAASLTAVGYLFKELRAADRAALERAMAQEAAHRTTLEKILPVVEKLTGAVEILERLTTSVLKSSKDETS